MPAERRVLISGAGGYLGQHLVNAFRADWNVTGVGRSAAPEGIPCAWVQAPDSADGLAQVAAGLRPDLLVHAAFVNRPAVGSDHETYLLGLSAVQDQLFSTCARLDIPLLLIGSSAVYGMAAERGPIAEDAPLAPLSLYGRAKAEQERSLREAMAGRGVRTCIARLFNLLGPGPGLGTVVHDWISQIAGHTGGGSRRLEVRTLATSRDFVDPRDAAGAVLGLAHLLLEGALQAGESFNVGSGSAVSLREILEELRILAGGELEVLETRPPDLATEPPSQQADIARIHGLIGWSPTTPWRRSMLDVWNQYAPARP